MSAALTRSIYMPPAAATPWRLAELFAPSKIRFYRYGRHALAGALRAAGGGTALLPGFFCREVLSAVTAADAKTLFYSVGPDLRPDRDSATWPEARAVLAVDYFGFPADLAPFRAYARRTGAVIVEDASHALFSRDEEGRLLGSRADVGVMSPRKTLPLLDSSARAAARRLFASAGARAARTLLEGFRAVRGFDWRDRTGREGSESEPLGDAGPELAGPVTCGDEAGERSRRRALYGLCAGVARTLGLSPVFASLPDGVVPYGFPFRASPAAADGAYAAYRRLGLSVLPWPDLPEAVRADAPAHYRDVYLAHFLW